MLHILTAFRYDLMMFHHDNLIFRSMILHSLWDYANPNRTLTCKSGNVRIKVWREKKKKNMPEKCQIPTATRKTRKKKKNHIKWSRKREKKEMIFAVKVIRRTFTAFTHTHSMALDTSMQFLNAFQTKMRMWMRWWMFSPIFSFRRYLPIILKRY